MRRKRESEHFLLRLLGCSLAKRLSSFFFLASSRLKYFQIAILVASLMLSVGIVAQEPSKPSPERNQEQAKEDQPHSATFSTIPVRIVADDSSVAEKRKQPTEYYEQHDLEAQLRMADATETSATYSLWLLIATVVEIGALIWVLTLNIQANRVSRAATKTAQDANALTAEANKITSDFFRIEKRARMYVIEINVEVIHADIGRMTRCRFVPVWKNVGPTPARNAKFNCGICPGATDAGVSIFPRDEFGDSTVVGAGVTFTTPSSDIDLTTLKSLARKETRYFVYTVVEYNDIFSDDLRVTESCSEFLLDVPEDNIEVWARSTKGGYGFKGVGPQNRDT